VLISIAHVGQCRCLGQEQDGDLLERATKLYGRGCFIAQNRHLGRDKRMFEDMNIAGPARLLQQTQLDRTTLGGEAKSRTTIAQRPDEKTSECNGVIR